jgi:hypothetical protein
MFDIDHSLFGENATVLIQIDPLPVCLVHLVSLMQPNKQDRLADFFNILRKRQKVQPA